MVWIYFIKKNITLKEALCGFKFSMTYITGKTFQINNASGNIIKPTFKKIIPNFGLERDKHKGNLIITFDISFPEKLDETQIVELAKIL